MPTTLLVNSVKQVTTLLMMVLVKNVLQDPLLPSKDLLLVLTVNAVVNPTHLTLNVLYVTQDTSLMMANAKFAQ